MTLTDLLAAAEAGAATVYHDVLAIARNVQSWEASPVVAPLLEIGVTAANAMLERGGLPGAIITSDVLGALKLLAVKDATVPSLGPSSAVSAKL